MLLFDVSFAIQFWLLNVQNLVFRNFLSYCISVNNVCFPVNRRIFLLKIKLCWSWSSFNFSPNHTLLTQNQTVDKNILFEFVSYTSYSQNTSNVFVFFNLLHNIHACLKVKSRKVWLHQNILKVVLQLYSFQFR